MIQRLSECFRQPFGLADGNDMTEQNSSMNVQAKREKLLKQATTASVATAVFLVILKAVAWLFSGSASILASLADSLTDCLASALNWVAVRYALQPADDHHVFGHGKAEGLSALLQAAFIGGAAVFLLLNAANRLIHPEPLVHVSAGVIVMLISVAVTLVLITFQRYVLAQTESTAVAADKLHYVSDLASNAAVLAALVLSAFGWHSADAWLALVLSLWMVKSAYDIGREAVDMLMDKSLPAEQVTQLIQAALSVEHVCGVHDVKTRKSGGMVFVQIHIECPGELNLHQAHEASHQASNRIRALFDHAEVVVHQDPV